MALVGAVLLVAATMISAANAANAANASNAAQVKVFVVPQASQSNGHPATLQSIAALTLGDPARANEIFQLNRGRSQPDGARLNTVGDRLHPGWILRLPNDASGAQVRLATDTGGENGAARGGTHSADTGSGPETSATEVPLAAVLAVFGSIALALVTAGIVGRRHIAHWLAALRRMVRRFGDPARRRRRLILRQSVAQRFAADQDSVRRAYSALSEFSAKKQHPQADVYAVSVEPARVTVWLAAADALRAPWQKVDDTRWQRPATATSPRGSMGSTGWEAEERAQSTIEAACLVRVGTDDENAPVFVDLSRLDGVLSVTGDCMVVRDVVQNLLVEVSISRPGTAVTVLRGTNGGPPVAVPAGLQQITRVETQPGRRPSEGTVRAAATRRPVRGVVVLDGMPTERDRAELAALCGPGGAGWTGLVCGEVGGEAHWRWYADDAGRVDIPTLGLQLTVPA